MINKLFKKLFLPVLYLFYRDSENEVLKVLSYHRVTQEQDLGDPLKVSSINFEKQIVFLKKHYNLISAEQLVEIINGKTELPSNPCLITFDDGWGDNYSQAFPILKKHNVPAIIFISTDFIDSSKVFWHELLQVILKNITCVVTAEQLQSELNGWPGKIIKDLTEIINSPISNRQDLINEIIQDLKKYDPKKINDLNEILGKYANLASNDKITMLTWAQVKEMSANNIHFGSHTVNHTILTQVDNNLITYELTASKRAIEDNIGKKVYFFSYPNGGYNHSMLELVREAGYIAAFAMGKGIDFASSSLFEIKRYMMREDPCINLNGKFSELLFKMELDGFRGRVKRKTKDKSVIYRG